MKFAVRARDLYKPAAPGDRFALHTPCGPIRFDGDYIVTSVGAIDESGWQELDLAPWPRGPRGQA